MTNARRAPRVVFVTTSSGAGGAEFQVKHLAEALSGRGWDVGVVSMLPLEFPLADLPSVGVKTGSLRMRQGVPDPRAMLRLRGLLRDWRPDVLHGHMVHANLMVRVSRLLRPTPVVISTMHNQDEGAQWRYVAYRLTDRLSDFTSTVSAVAREEAIRRGAAQAGRIAVVPNGIPMSPYDRDLDVRDAMRRTLGVEGSFVWLAVGRLVEAKRHVDLISAFEQARERHPSSMLLIAGEGPLESEIRAAIRDARLDDAAVLLGLRNDVPRIMQAADGFALSSLWEGLPMVLLEAGASSLPIVATEVGGTREAVVDGVTGHVVPPGVPGSLASAMTRIMDLDPAALRAMGVASHDHIARGFDLEEVVTRWEGIYATTLRAKGRDLAGGSGNAT